MGKLPSSALVAFYAGFLIASVVASIACIYGLDIYEKKWSPEFNLVLNILGFALLAVPAVFFFAIGLCFKLQEQNPWRQSLAGGAAHACALLVLATLAKNSTSYSLVFGLLCGLLSIGAACIGVVVRATTTPPP